MLLSLCIPLFLAIQPSSSRALFNPGSPSEQLLFSPPSVHDLNNDTFPLRNLQISHPPIVPKGGKSCKVLLLHHAFANSYYTPAIVDYSPPSASECGAPSDWAALVLTLEVTVNGTQFDRLGSISLGNVEISRTSTAEPTKTGIIWTADKDVSRFLPLFHQNNSRLMFDENNIVAGRYTGIFDTKLWGTFYTSTPHFPIPSLPDLIIPLSTKSETHSQMMNFPGDSTSNLITIPSNSAEAYVEILATGNGDEEFWYTNLPDELVEYFDEDSGILAKGPLREVQLLVDGLLAGVVSPFPVLYTGGAIPLLWRPLASLRAFDIPSFFVDITPFLPILTDTAPHNFTLIVIGQGVDHSINNNWFLTGSLHIKLDKSLPVVRTTGKIVSHTASPFPATSLIGHVDDKLNKVEAFVTSQCTLEIVSIVTTGSGTNLVKVTQDISFSNKQVFLDGGAIESVLQEANSTSTSHHGDLLHFSDMSSFPIELLTNYSLCPKSFSATIGPAYSYDRLLHLPSFLAGKGVQRTGSSQVGEASLTRNEDGSSYTGVSWTDEIYDFEETGEVYHRVVRAANSSIVSDVATGTLTDKLRPALEEESPQVTQYPITAMGGKDVVEGIASSHCRKQGTC